MTTPTDDDLLTFEEEAPAARQPGREEDAAPPAGRKQPNWKLLIVDDEAEVHNVTRLVLSGFSYKGRGIEFLSAYTGAQARELLAANPDIAVILLDVVMEDNDTGLKLVQYIREEMHNQFVRIILRTGQPGQAPEERVIVEYDINDYKEKTELTAQKLITSIVAALRTSCDITTIEASRRGLEKIIEASETIFELQSMEKFSTGVLTQITSILDLDRNALFCQASGFAAVNKKGEYYILAATGDFQRHIAKPVREAVSPEVFQRLQRTVNLKHSLVFDGRCYLGYFRSRNGSESIIYLEGCQDLSPLDTQLVEIFFSNVSIAFDNIHLNKEMEDTQREIIQTLGETIEWRSHETGNHVRRVAEYIHILAQRSGMEEHEATLLRLAAPMHDVGKLAVADSILNKPGPLSEEEMQIIQSHAQIGYDILKSSTREMLKAAAVIAHQHHERWDGLGYPLGLAGENIHVYGRMAAVADVFDALMSDRVYRPAWSLDKVVEHFRQERGRHFDPAFVDILLGNLDEFLRVHRLLKD
jgi:response regulator RpfG family c-di-GMP phosphodiesterase